MCQRVCGTKNVSVELRNKFGRLDFSTIYPAVPFPLPLCPLLRNQHLSLASAQQVNTQKLSSVHSNLVSIKRFAHKVLCQSRTSGTQNVLQTALYYLDQLELKNLSTTCLYPVEIYVLSINVLPRLVSLIILALTAHDVSST